MTKVFYKLTGSTNILTNSIAAVALTGVLCLITAFVLLAWSNGIKTF